MALANVIRQRWPVPNPCLTCPPWPLLEEIIYGQIARVAIDRADRVHERIGKEGEITAKALDFEAFEREVKAAVVAGVEELVKQHRESIGHTQELLTELERAGRTGGQRG